MAGAWDFDLMTLGSFGVPPFEVRVDGSVLCRDQHPARFASPRSRGDDCFEIVSQVEHLRSCHESGLLSRQVGCEVIVKLCGIEVSETVCRLLYRSRLAEIAREAFPVVSFIFAGIWHVRRDVNQCHDLRVVRGFGDYRSTITVSDNNARSVLLSDHALRRSDIFFEGRLWLLNDADPVAVFDENVVDAFPA